jgi:hypothetical protein
LAIPGGVGALLGATFLSSIDLSTSKIFISTLFFFRWISNCIHY